MAHVPWAEHVVEAFGRLHDVQTPGTAHPFCGVSELTQTPQNFWFAAHWTWAQRSGPASPVAGPVSTCITSLALPASSVSRPSPAPSRAVAASVVPSADESLPDPSSV